MTLPTFDVVSVNIPIISFSCCTHTFNDTNIGMYMNLLIVGKNVGGRRLQGQLCVWGAGKYPFRNVVLNTHVYRLLPILMYVFLLYLLVILVVTRPLFGKSRRTIKLIV